MGINMTVNNSFQNNAFDNAFDIENEILELAQEININELYQIKSRLMTNINNLSGSVDAAFKNKNRLDRIRSFVLITGKLLETRDYLQLLLKLRIHDTSDLISKIDEFTDFIMINSGSLN